MKLFQVVRKNYAILGIHPSHQSNQGLSFNTKELFGFFLIGGLISSQAMYISYVANGFTEYMNCVCAISATMVVFVCFATIVIRKAKLFKMVDYIERLIDTSKAIFNSFILWLSNLNAILNSGSFALGSKYPKSRKLFRKMSRQIDRLSEIVFTLLVKIGLQLIILTICAVSFASYFGTDAGSDAFQLSFPMW